MSATALSRWNFNGGTGTTAFDDIGAKHATLGTGAGWGAGIRGAYGLTVNGTSTANAVSSTSVLNTTASFSVSAFVKLTNTTGWQTVVSQDATQVSGFSLQLRGDVGAFAFTRHPADAASTSVFARADVAPVAGQWYHLAGVFNATAKTMALYVNGRLQQTITSPTTAIASTGAFVIGRGKYGGTGTDFLNGTIDEARAFSGTLNAGDVEQLAANADYNFDEGTGTSAADSTQSAFTGTLTNGPLWTPGVIGPSALDFDGVNDFVSTPNAVLDTSKSFSVSAWARADVTNATDVVLSLDGTNRSAFTVQMGSDGKWAFTRPASDAAGATVTLLQSQAVATAGTWYHLIAVYDSVAGTVLLYVDGGRQQSTSYTGGWKGTGLFAVGRGKAAGASSNYLDGAVDEVHVYPFIIDDALASTLAAPPPPPKPAAPTATAGNATTTVSWVAPAPISGSPATGYVVTPYLNGTAQTPQTFNNTATTQTFTGLTNGGSYTYTVAAINANGTSAASSQSAAVVPAAPATVPAAPSAPTATAGTSAASVSWTAPAGNGSAITGYVVTPYVGTTAGTAQTFNSTATTQTVTGLTAGTSYTFKVAAVNGVGTGAQSAASNAVTPNANPVIVVAAPPSGQVGVAYSFTLTRSGGTSPFTWSISAGNQPGGLTLGASTGVLSGTPTTAGSYAFTAKVTDASGATDTEPVTVVITDKPAQPAAPTATAGVTSASVSWTAPPSNGSPITGYRVTPYIGATAQTPQTFNSTATTQTLTGLTAGAAYTFTVAAINALGTGSDSGQSAAVTPYDVPGAPTAVTATAGAQSASLSWTAPSTNGSAITGFRVTPYIGGTAQTPVVFSSAATTQTVTGLTAGTAYTFTVAARNAAGYGAPSTPSSSVTPNADRPATPATPTATAGALAATVTWVAPASNGSALTGYQVTPYLNGVAQTAVSYDASTTTRTVTGLTVGGSYTFTVAAINAVGTSGASPQSNTVFPYDVPGAPTITAATAGTQRVTLTWGPPNSNGSTVTGYVVTPYIGATAQTPQTFASAALTQTVTGLTAGTTYTFKVAATNAAGTGPQSAVSPTVAPNAAPTLTFGNPPLAFVGAAYSNQFVVTGGTSPFTWSVSAGTLPAGLSLSAGGLLSGTPTTVSSATITIQVVDGSGQVATKAVTVTVADRPATPAVPAATAGLTSAVLSWTAPGANNSTITAYVITPYQNGTAQPTITVDPSAKTRTLNGLTPGSVYSFTIAATNAAGTSAASATSNPVTPYAALNEPTITSLTAGSTSARLTWTAPTSTGGSPITGYVVTPYIGATAQAPQTFASTATTQTVTGLTAGTSYTFKVAARNSSGADVLYRINAGGPAVAAVDSGPTWADDSGTSNPLRNIGSGFGTFSPGATSDWTVPATTPAQVFDSERYDGGVQGDGGEMAWAFPVATGTPVKVRLYFANRCACTSLVDQRIFDVALDQSTVLDDLDIIRAAGGNATGTMREFATASDGTVNIDFLHQRADNPLINGIEILQTGTATTGPQSAASAPVTPNASPTLTFAAPPTAQLGVAYSNQLTVTGGTSPYTWSISGPLPAGFSLNSTSGLLSGTPTTTGSYPLTIQVTDASDQTASRGVTLVVIDRPARPTAPTAVAGTTRATVTWVEPATNGSPITSYVVTPYRAGVAQPTSTFDPTTTTRTLTGLTAAASYAFSVIGVNGAGASDESLKSSAVVPYDVPAAPVITSAQAVDLGATLSWTAPSTNGSTITGYVVTPIISSTAQPPQSFGGTTTTATITGLTAGTSYTFTVAAQNTAGAGPASASSAAVTPNALPTLNFPAPSAGEVGVAYSRQLSVTDGTAPYSWSVSSGSLPVGLTLSSSGLLSGTPTAAGSTSFTVRVLDASNNAATRNVTLVVVAAPSAAFAPAAGEVGASYGQSATVTGGTASYNWTMIAGALPAGLALNTSTGLVSGTPTAPGSFSVTLQVTDSFGQTADVTATIDIAPQPTLNSSPPAGRVGVAYSFTFSASGGTGPFIYTLLSGTLPQGLSLSSAGVLSGTPASLGTTAFTVQTVDSFGQTASRTVNLVIDVPPISVVKSASPTSVGPGGTVTFTVTARNLSSTGYTGLHLYDPLSNVLDDASYSGNAAASSGTIAYAGSQLDWGVDLAAGATASMTYVVTVTNPDTGNKVLSGQLSSAFASTNCNPGSQTAACDTRVTVSTLSIVKTANVATTTPGSAVTFSVVVTNSGQTAYSSATFTDDLRGSGVLDDATYTDTATTTSGTIGYTSGVLTWTGSLAVGASATVTYTVTVTDPDIGNRSVTSTIVSSSVGSTCPTGNPASSCSAAVTVLIPALSIHNTRGASTATPGAAVTFAVTLTNTGQTAYTNTTVNVALAAAQDDAAFGAATATSGTVSFDAATSTVAWTGNIAMGASVTISLAGTVRNPDPGDKLVTTMANSSAPGSSCPVGTTSSSCSATVQVLLPQLTLTKTADRSSVAAGGTVAYTLTATNTGETAYASATLSDSLAPALQHATYNGDAISSSGQLSYAAGVLSWTGSLAVGQALAITYSVKILTTDPGDAQLLNRVVSDSAGSNCPTASTNGSCATSTAIEAATITLGGLSSSFKLTGLPGTTKEQDSAVVGSVMTNNFAGYTVTVQAQGNNLVGKRAGNPDTIPIQRLRVRRNGTITYSPLSATNPVVVSSRNSASASSGDAVSNDYQVEIPFVASDDYSATLDYIVTAQ